MQLILDADQPVIITKSRTPDGRSDVYEFHNTNENGTTSLTMAVVLELPPSQGDLAQLGLAVRVALS